MTDTVWAAIVGGVAGIVTGSISSLIAPWANWGIEKRRQKLNARRERIDQWRKMVRVKEFERDSFRETTGYSTLRPYLSDELVQQIEGTEIIIQDGGRGGGVNGFKAEILDEISEIEKKWKLL